MNTTTTYSKPAPKTGPVPEGEPRKVLVAMSGGVDSSVTAAILKTQGHEVVGVHMQLWDHGDANVERFGGRCCSLIDSNDARRVCDKIDIPYYVINGQEVFQDKVVDYFVHEYLMNRTPNPCIQCNNQIKFSYLFQKAEELGCDWVATGHYAQVNQDMASGRAKLEKAVDPQKDQTYFLFGLTQKALKRTMMPLGWLPKMMVRKLAEEYSLVTANKPDSQEICFIGEEGYKGFIEKRVAPILRPKGVIQTPDGRIIGEHDGLYRYTIGQRKGLRIHGKDTESFFVVGFDPRNHVLIVGPEDLLFKESLVATDVNWIAPVLEESGLRGIECSAKIRSMSGESPCRVTLFENKTVHVEFAEKQRAITPGQAIVFYKDREVLGGGFIDRAGNP